MSQAIAEVSQLSFEEFHREVIPAGKPLVIRGLVKDWPIVKAGLAGPVEFCNYLRRFDTGHDVNTVFGPPSIKGRFFYNADLSGLNCKMGQSKLGSSLDYLLEHMDDDPLPTLAMQSVLVNRYLSGMEHENPIPLLTKKVDPRIWIGGKVIVAAHYDPSENIACCVAGRRLFTLLPPEQIGNLYVGPLEHTPAGAAISMVDFDHPDYEKFPRFADAEKAFLTATLEPGDAIFIPYLWWHHVRSLDKINALMNYWWNDFPSLIGNPKDAMLHSMMTIRQLPAEHRAAWLHVFQYYVFGQATAAGEHLPEDRRGILGNPSEEQLTTIRSVLVKALNKI